MKKHISLLMIFFICLELNAQEYYYYYKGAKQYLTLDKTKLNITTSIHF